MLLISDHDTHTSRMNPFHLCGIAFPELCLLARGGLSSSSSFLFNQFLGVFKLFKDTVFMLVERNEIKV